VRIVRFVLALLFLAPAIAALALVAALIVKQFAAAADEGRQVGYAANQMH
jgi:hypothetical protein